MQMLASNVLVYPEKRTEQKIGSIVLPDNDERAKAFARGTVKEVGPGLFLQNGDRPAVEVIEGDRVLYFKAGAINIVVEKQDMHIIREAEIVAILDQNDVTSEGEE